MAVSKNIKGITIEFNGDTTKLGKALEGIRKDARGVDAQLKQVDKALKFNPKNTELLAQKQQLLGQKVDLTKKRLDALREAQAKMDADPSVDKTSQDYTELRREIIVTESQLKNFTKRLKEVENIKFKQVGEQFQKVGGKIESVGKTLTTSLTVPIVGAYTAAAKLASDYEENLNKIDVAFGSSADEVKNWANNARDQFGLSKVAATGAVSAFGALGKGLGLAEGDAASMSTSLAGLSADLASYFNTGTDESAKALEGIFTGESEALKKFGVVMTDTNLEKFAADQGLVWKEMDQSEKTMLRYQYVMAKTKDAQGDYARTSDGTANSIKTFKAAVEDLGTAIGTNLLPIITPIVNKLAEWVQKFADLDPATQKVITIAGILVAALGPVLIFIGKVATGIGSIITLIPKLGAAFTFLTGPVGIVIGILAALVAAGVLVYKNWDKIKAAAKKLKEFVTGAFKAMKESVAKTFNDLKDAMLAPIRAARDAIKKIIEKIKSFFDFDFKLPDLKTPHFTIDPPGWSIGDLLQGVIPDLNVDWYAKGGIFRSPSIIGVGEAGAEAVLPIDRLQGMLAGMADSIVNGILMGGQLQQAGAGGEIKIVNYLYPNGPAMGEQTVRMYDQYKRILG